MKMWAEIGKFATCLVVSVILYAVFLAVFEDSFAGGSLYGVSSYLILERIAKGGSGGGKS